MTTIELMVTLPEALAAQAKSAGLLEEGALARMLEAELERRSQGAADRFFAAVDDLRSLEPPLTQAEIDAEIEAYKAEKNAELRAEQHAKQPR